MNKPAKGKSALDIIRSHHGSSAVFGGNEEITFNVKATSSGSIALDDAIGCGGLPDGRLILWSGPESSGKTLGSLCFAKKKQAEGKRILFIDAEFTWDQSWVSKLGLKTDPEYMMVAQESSGIKIFDLLCGKAANKKRTNAIPGILSDEIIQQMADEGTPLGAIIIDSINTVQPPMEEDMDTGATQVGALSRFLPPVLRRLTPLLGKYGIPCIFICQARTNIGQMHGDPLTVSGGKALMHAASVWIDSRKIASSEIYKDDDKDKELPIGHQVRCKIRKNKVGAPSRKAELTIYYERGIDLRPELLDQGIAREIIRNEGNSYMYSGFAGGRVVGRNNAMIAIYSDRNLQTRLLKDIIDHRTNATREAKKEGGVFIDDELEESVPAEEAIKTRFADDAGKPAKILASEQAESKRIVISNGKRIDTATGEVLPPLATSPKEGEDEFVAVKEEDPAIDQEDAVVVLDDPLEETTKPGAPVATAKAAAAAPTKPADPASLSITALKDLAKKRNIKNWYKLSRDELVAALK